MGTAVTPEILAPRTVEELLSEFASPAQNSANASLEPGTHFLPTNTYCPSSWPTNS